MSLFAGPSDELARPSTMAPRPRPKSSPPRASDAGPDRPATVVLLALVVALATVSALVVSLLSPRVYGARAEVLFDLGQAQLQEGQRQLETAARLGESRPVLLVAASATGLTVSEVDEALSFEPAGDSSVLEVTAVHREPQIAARLAQVGAEAVIARMPAAAELPAVARIQDELSEAVETEARLEARLRELEAERAATPESPPVPSVDERLVEAELRQAINRRGQLESRLLAIELDDARTRPPQLLSDAYVLDEPLRPRPVRDAFAGMVFGTMVAGVLGFALWWRRHGGARSLPG
jgi:uncharacterized protein involved in exopolysaccharide biosynthesis